MNGARPVVMDSRVVAITPGMLIELLGDMQELRTFNEDELGSPSGALGHGLSASQIWALCHAAAEAGVVFAKRSFYGGGRPVGGTPRRPAPSRKQVPRYRGEAARRSHDKPDALRRQRMSRRPRAPGKPSDLG